MKKLTIKQWVNSKLDRPIDQIRGLNPNKCVNLQSRVALENQLRALKHDVLALEQCIKELADHVTLFPHVNDDYCEYCAQARCIGCGCTDEEACMEPEICSWLEVNRYQGVGVCSNCKRHLERFQEGDYSPAFRTGD